MSGPPNGFGTTRFSKTREVRHAAEERRAVDRVAARVGDHEAPAIEEHVDRVGVDCRVADAGVRVDVALEGPDVGDRPRPAVVLDPQQAAEEVGGRVLRGERVARDVGAVGVLGLGRPAVGDEDLIGAEDGDAVRPDRVGRHAHRVRVGHGVRERRQPLDDAELVSTPVDLGDRAAGAHAGRPLAGDEARAGSATARLGDEEVAARAEREVARRVEAAGDDVDLRGRGPCGRRKGRREGQDDWYEKL